MYSDTPPLQPLGVGSWDGLFHAARSTVQVGLDVATRCALSKLVQHHAASTAPAFQWARRESHKLIYIQIAMCSHGWPRGSVTLAVVASLIFERQESGDYRRQ